MDFLIIGFFWLMFSAAVASYASNRGRCGWCWMVASMVFSPLIGFIFVAVSPNWVTEAKAKKEEDEKQEKERQTEAELEDSKTCPMCAESVKKAAKICRYCGHEFDEETLVASDPPALEAGLTAPTSSLVATDDEPIPPWEDRARASGQPPRSAMNKLQGNQPVSTQSSTSGLSITRGVVLVAVVLFVISIYLGYESLLGRFFEVDEQNIESDHIYAELVNESDHIYAELVNESDHIYAELVKRCKGAEYTGAEHGVTDTIINVLLGPGPNYTKIINPYASTYLKTAYIQIDTTFTVYEVCRKEGWAFIEVIKPDWLSDSHRGWVETRFLGDPIRTTDKKFEDNNQSKGSNQIIQPDQQSSKSTHGTYQQPTNSNYESYQKSSSPGATLVKRCAAKAGIPANEPKHVITPQEMSRLASCLDR